MRILITNDDGINASGIKLLAEFAVKYGEVIVVAPLVEQSATSHAIRIRNGMSYEKIEDIVEGVSTYTLDSTPADCVRFAKYFLKDNFDIVFSGINNGYNLGEDVMYSGTVGGASEGVLAGVKGIAFSCKHYDTSGAEKYFDEVMEFILNKKLMDDCDLLSVNFPLVSNGIRITKQGKTYFDTQLEEKENLVYQKGKPYFEKDAHVQFSDVSAIYNNYISITPLTVDRTDKIAFEKIIKK